jgi:outer membrane lipoprotein-sorting protein
VVGAGVLEGVSPRRATPASQQGEVSVPGFPINARRTPSRSFATHGVVVALRRVLAVSAVLLRIDRRLAQVLVAAVALTLAATASAQVGQSTPTLDALMQRLAAIREARADFTETRHSSALKAPLAATGVLRYVRPDRLEREVRTPRPERYVVAGDTLTIVAGAGPPRTIALAAQPALAAFLDTLRATLRGDLATLARHYRVELTTNSNRWQLVLLPADPALAEWVSSIRIAGEDVRLVEMEVVEASGDRIVTRFSGGGA